MRNLQNLYLWFIVLFLTGCANAKPYLKEFSALNMQDGISLTEAKTIGQYHFAQSDQVKVFKPGNPEILRDRLVEEYPNYWFVSFYPRDIDQHFYRYLVVVSKKSGEVVWEGVYQPLRIINYNWVFSAQKNYKIP